MRGGFTPPTPITSPQAEAAERARVEQRLRQLEEGHVIIEEPRRIYLRSPDGHFWQLTATDGGALVLVDAGTVRP